MRFTKLFLPFLLVAAFLIFASGCGSDRGNAQFRALNASPDAPNVDVLVGGKTVATNVAFATASSYTGVSAGNQQIEIRATGTSSDLVNITQNITKNSSYTAMAGNTLANINGVVFMDNNTAPASGQFNIRVIHGAPSLGSVDIYVGAPGSGATGTPAVSNLAFEAASSYLSLTAGTVEAYVTATGSTTVLIDSGPLTVSAGAVRTAVALDAPGGGAPQSVAVLNDLN